jgi:hypothetical protein
LVIRIGRTGPTGLHLRLGAGTPRPELADVLMWMMLF